jgi:chemotaxis protein histidine kinase CheA
MGFFKKLFTGIGFAAGFLFFGCLSVIVYASRGRHKPCHRRSSFWNTLERYLIFSWICDGVRSSRKRAEKSYYQRTGSDFWQTQKQARPESVKNTAPAEKKSKPEAKNTGTGATRSVKPKKTGPSSAEKKASAAQSGAKSVSVPTVLGQNVSETDAEKHSEWSKPKPEPKQEHAAQQSEAKEVHQKSAQQLEAERQQKLENLRAAMQKQICTIHADVELPANGQNDSEAAEQKLHILLYKSTLPENDLNRALDELRTERRRQKAEYQGAPFADVFLVNLILSDEDSERACIVDVGDTGMSYVIPWSSIPKDLQESLHRYVSEAEGKLCGYCKEELCNSESGRMVVELYLGKQDGHGSRILY